MFTKQLIALITVAATGLAACGGAGQSDSITATDTKGTALGTVSGFGSIIVDGTRYNDEQATITTENAAGVTTEASLDDVALGMQVEVSATGDNANEVVIHTTVIGPIESLSSNGFIAAGQQIQVDGDTYFVGASGVSDLSVGDMVGVHGVRDSNDVIQADRVRLRAPDADRLIRIVGVIRDLDATAQTFRLGQLTVDYSNDPRIIPQDATLANGRAVVVFSDALPTAGTLQASGLRLLRSTLIDGRRIRVAGLIRDLDPDALAFRLHWATIDASQAEFVNGRATDLANGRRARVLGTVRIGEDGVRMIEAQKVWTLGDQDDPVAISGAIRDFAGAASFTGRGVAIDASGQAVTFLNGSAENLADGVLVRIKGTPSGDKVVAETVQFYEPDTDRLRTVAGFIRNLSPNDNTFQIFQATVRVNADTVITHADGSAATSTDLQNGLWAVVRGDIRSGQFVARDIRLRDNRQTIINTIDGVVYQVDATRGRFRINGIAMQVDQQLVGSVTISNLRSGHLIRVRGYWDNGVFIVTSIVRI